METLVCRSCGGGGECLEDIGTDFCPEYSLVSCSRCGGSGQVPLVRDPILFRKTTASKEAAKAYAEKQQANLQAAVKYIEDTNLPNEEKTDFIYVGPW